MTYETFQRVFLANHPDGSVSRHSNEYACGQKVSTNHVNVTFTPNGRMYEYKGTYCEILVKTHCDFAFRSDIEYMKKKIAGLEESNGKPNPYSLFNKTPVDNTAEIERCKKELAVMESSKMILEE